MKISQNVLKGINTRYKTTGDITAIGVDKLIEKIGAQLGGVDEVMEIGDKYKGIVIAKVVACEKHPDADKLSLCKIDDGGKVQAVERDEQGHVQVVCGAPNVRAGMSVAWLPPGSTVPETYDKEPFVLEAREIRGKKSNGMLASPKELALGDNHSGILEIDGDPTPGSNFAETYGLKDDAIIDIENKMFTHRPDAFGWLGISRELAGIQNMAFKSPDWYQLNPSLPAVESQELAFKVINELPALVPRFSAIAISNVKVGPCPLWLLVELAIHGQKSINNIVDYTNYFMLQTGQPIHAYDYDKVKALSGDSATIVIRNPKPGEQIKLLNGKSIEPRAEAIMIATDKQLIGVGGVMGGSDTEVDENTKNIILEVANFDMYSIRRTSMTHGLFTDAVTRFTKGQSPLQNLAVLTKAVNEIREHANGKVASPLIDETSLEPVVLERGSLYPPVIVEVDFINSRLGLDLSKETMKQLLENVEFGVEIDDKNLIVKAPFWRTDIELREDVVEEVGRLYGYDKLPLILPRRDIMPVSKDSLLSLKAQIRATLAKAGVNEVLTYSFVHGDLLQKVGQDRDQAFQIANALSPDLQYYRLSLTPSLLDKVHANMKAGYSEFALFELGKAHQLGLEDEGVPIEMDRVALVVTAADKVAKHYSGAAYYKARKYLMNLLHDLKISKAIVFEPLDENKYLDSTKNKIPYYQAGRAATILIGDTVLGEIGEYKNSVRSALKLPEFSAGFELDLSLLLKHAGQLNGYTPLPHFPKVIQDITLKVPAELKYQAVFDFVWDQIEDLKPRDSIFELIPGNIYQNEAESDFKSLTFRLQIVSDERTLTDVEVNKLLDKVALAATEKFGAQRT